MTALFMPRPPRIRRVRCALCGRVLSVRGTWLVAGGRYCITHFSTDDRRLQREFEEDR